MAVHAKPKNPKVLTLMPLDMTVVDQAVQGEPVDRGSAIFMRRTLLNQAAHVQALWDHADEIEAAADAFHRATAAANAKYHARLAVLGGADDTSLV